MKKKEAEWQAKEKQLQDQLADIHGHAEHQELFIQQMKDDMENIIQRNQSELEHRTHILEAKFQEAKSETEGIAAAYKLLHDDKEKEEYKRAKSAPWQAADGRTIAIKLEKLKKGMRTLGKGLSIIDLSILQRLSKVEHMALMKDLANICVLTNDKIPEGLSSAKPSFLLLNALLAHHVYTALFETPFFFLANGLGGGLSTSGLDSLLNEMYRRMQQGECSKD
jgi:hypothetical protein